MINHFQYILFHNKIETEKTTVQKQFLEFKQMLNFNKKLFSQTVAFYSKSYKDEMEVLSKEKMKAEVGARKKYKEVFNKEQGNDEGNHLYAMHVSGLDHISESYQIEHEEKIELYRNFLDSIAKSMIITIYSLIESHLMKICNVFQGHFSKKVAVEHFNSKNYLKGAIDYLDLVIELNQTNYIGHYTKLKDYQNLRNCFIHSDSQTDKSQSVKITNIVKDSVHIIDTEHDKIYVKIAKREIVENLFNLAELFIENIHWAFEEKLNYDPIKTRCLTWLKLLSEDSTISAFNILNKSQSKLNLEFFFTSKKENVSNVKCNIEVIGRVKSSFLVENKTKHTVLDDFLKFTKEHQNVMFKGVLALIFTSKPSLRISIGLSD